MKISIIILFTLFLSTSAAVETCDYSENYIDDAALYDESLSIDASSMDEEARWLINLSKHLLQNDDINISTMALSYLNMYFAGRLDSKTDSPVFDSKLKLSVLNKIIESESATTPTLLAARSMCKESDVAGKCDVDRFNQKLFIQDPENLNIYFNELNQAVKDADVELIAVILRQMSQAKYSRSLSPISAEFITAVDAYIQENPFAEATILASLEGLLGDRTEVDVNSLMKQSMLQMFYIINFSNIPALQPLIVACEQFQQDAQYCQSIANTLRNRSDTNVMVMMGYGLDEKVSEIFGDAESLTKSQAAQQAFTDYQMCLLQNHALIDDPLYMFDPGFVTIMIQGQHEGANLELGALYFYDKLKDSGHEGVVDPRTCGLRYVEVN